jgi:hypothetical protein
MEREEFHDQLTDYLLLTRKREGVVSVLGYLEQLPNTT